MAYTDYKEKSAVELQGLLAEERGRLHDLRNKHAIGQLKNTREIAATRTRIAHIMTALSAQR
ncbi:50S ribosomal protein L29 [Candidatus Uhrbacteria bacterium]|nr:50S ribosomal protein L29 [Candidatus Uhrbacteria bacterium]